MKTFTKTLLFAAVILLSGCATIISGSRQEVEIASDPSSAKVYINEIEIGNTPVQRNLKRNQDYKLTLKLDGYEAYETSLEKKFNAWYIGNVAFGGLIGLVVDPITGAIHKLKPEEIDGNLKSGTTYDTKGGKLLIKISMNADSDSEIVGQLKKQ